MQPEINDDYEGDQDDTLDDSEDSVDISVDADVEPMDEKELAAARQKADEVAEAESLTVTAKLSQRQQLEAELAKFLAQGGRITEVPPDESAEV